MLRKTNVNIESGSWRFITLSSRPSETFVAKQKTFFTHYFTIKHTFKPFNVQRSQKKINLILFKN